MAQKFQYDESGTTFYYFLLSFLALVLVPCSYYFWPRKKKEDPEKKIKQCHCERCLVKNSLLEKQKPMKNVRQYIIQGTIICGWLLFLFIAYKVMQFDYEYANFDPYEILGISIGASNAEIKKAYKKKALIYHPDKETGDEKLFMKLTKAYDALTDEIAKRNWEQYGNPDGPSAISFGIALPSWIVEKENSLWVLLVYALVFMIILPVTVGIWWSRSIKYSGEKVLLDTSQMYYYFFHKTPNMVMKRVIMVLGASAEFHVKHNAEIQERPSDNQEVPLLFKQLPQLNEKNKERPLCFSYSVKARALIHAHLTRVQLNPYTLEKDRIAVVRKCPVLIHEMVVCISQLMMLAHAGRISRIPSLSSLEHAMKLCPMIVQALWDYKNPLLQLPHLEEDMLKHFNTKKLHVKTLEQLARLGEDDRRICLRSLTEDQYQNVCRVLANMPLLDVHYKTEVVDDEETTVFTAGAIVTVTVTLIRKQFGTLLNIGGESTITSELVGEPKDGEVEEKEEKEEEEKKKTPVWKPKTKPRKGGGGGKKPAKKSNAQNHVKPAVEAPVVEEKEKKEEATPKRKAPSKKPVKKNESDSEEDSDVSDSESEDDTNSHSQDEKLENKAPEDDDEEWDKFQNPFNKRQKALEGKSRISHSVHCPYFPEDKQEYWWVYISDRKNQLMLTAPFYVTSLVDKEDVQMRFTAPLKPGIYTFTLCVRSDSYLGFDQFKDIKMDVKEAPELPKDHPQWDISSDEDENKEASAAESEYATDEDDDNVAVEDEEE